MAHKKGPVVSDGPLVSININRGTNEAIFADHRGGVNISKDRHIHDIRTE